MKLEKWALVAEIIGGVAIVVTLAVLILEVRNNTAAVRAATLSDIMGRSHDFGLLAPRNQELAEITVRLNRGDELSATEQWQARSLLAAAMKLGEEAFLAHRDGLLDDEIWETRAALVTNMMTVEARRRMYQDDLRTTGTFVPSYISWLDGALVEKFGE